MPRASDPLHRPPAAHNPPGAYVAVFLFPARLPPTVEPRARCRLNPVFRQRAGNTVDSRLSFSSVAFNVSRRVHGSRGGLTRDARLKTFWCGRRRRKKTWDMLCKIIIYIENCSIEPDARQKIVINKNDISLSEHTSVR